MTCAPARAQAGPAWAHAPALPVAGPKRRGLSRGLFDPRLLVLVAALSAHAALAAAVFTCASSGNDATTCAALGDLYTATNGASWASNSGWSSAAAGTATDYCTFGGIFCRGDVVFSMCVCACNHKATAFY